jgi:hypothetical protein
MAHGKRRGGRTCPAHRRIVARASEERDPGPSWSESDGPMDDAERKAERDAAH